MHDVQRETRTSRRGSRGVAVTDAPTVTSEASALPGGADVGASDLPAPRVLTDQDKLALRLTMADMNGRLVTLNEFQGALKRRISFLTVQAKLDSKKANEIYYRRAEANEALSGIVKRGTIIQEQARELAKQFPEVFGVAEEQPVEAKVEVA